MESIGELAQRTGTSRRMLRHWESLGLLTPAVTDPATNRRQYAPAQSGRVRAIATLRAVGFSLDTIRDLLDQGLTESRLTQLLEERESELAGRIDRDSAALAHVRDRLNALKNGHHTIVQTLTKTSLAEVRLMGVQESVTDETEIPGAVERLLGLLDVATSTIEQDVLLVFDGTTDETVITVSAARADGSLPHRVDEAARTLIAVPGAHHAVTARFDQRPNNAGDAWVALDAHLATAGRRSAGPYRQTLHAHGAVTLASPTVEL